MTTCRLRALLHPRRPAWDAQPADPDVVPDVVVGIGVILALIALVVFL